MSIQSFACNDTASLYRTGVTKRFGNIAKVALRKLDMLNSAVSLNGLRAPPANRLEALKGKRAGQHSI